MILKKLTEIFKTFDKDEVKKFGRFIRSDYFNTNERITLLFKTLKKFYPSFDDPKLTNEYLFKEIYGSRKFDDKTFRYLLAELMELAERFISFSPVETDLLERDKSVIEAFITRALFNQASSLLKSKESKLEKDFFISGTYLQHKIDYSHLWHQLIFYSDRLEPNLIKRVELGEFITVRSMIEICHLYQNFFNIKVNYNIDAEENVMTGFVQNFNYKGMYDYISNLISKSTISESRRKLINAFKIYMCFMITFIDKKDEEYFNKMRELVENYGKHFEKEELQNLYIMLTSCCNIKRQSIDDSKYLKIYFDVVKAAISKDLMTAYEGQYMDISGFFRIFNTAIYFKEYVWAETFVSKYVNRLSPDFMDDMHNYTCAELYFRMKNYDEALKLLSKVRYKFPRLKHSVRSLTLMIYYEKNYIEEAFSLIDSFTHFLNGNNKVSRNITDRYLNLTSAIRDLLKYKTKFGERKKISEIRNGIVKTDLMENRDWLLEKIDELKNN